jgi:NADH-quinone oxidoreductase subunit G
LGGTPDFVSGLDNGIDAVALNLATVAGGLERLADVPIHFADALARRAPALQQARDSVAPAAGINAATLAKLGLGEGDRVRVAANGEAGVLLTTRLDRGLPDDVVRIAAAHADTRGLGPMSASLTVEKA